MFDLWACCFWILVVALAISTAPVWIPLVLAAIVYQAIMKRLEPATVAEPFPCTETFIEYSRCILEGKMDKMDVYATMIQLRQHCFGHGDAYLENFVKQHEGAVIEYVKQRVSK